MDVTNLVDATKSGNKKATLIALRDILAETIQKCDSGRDMASNSKRLMEVIEEIEAIEKQEEEQKRKAEQKTTKMSKHDRLKRKNESR